MPPIAERLYAMAVKQQTEGREAKERTRAERETGECTFAPDVKLTAKQRGGGGDAGGGDAVALCAARLYKAAQAREESRDRLQVGSEPLGRNGHSGSAGSARRPATEDVAHQEWVSQCLNHEEGSE